MRHEGNQIEYLNGRELHVISRPDTRLKSVHLIHRHRSRDESNIRHALRDNTRATFLSFVNDVGLGRNSNLSFSLSSAFPEEMMDRERGEDEDDSQAPDIFFVEKELGYTPIPQDLH